MRIAVDAMGGDHAPREVVAGTVKAAAQWAADTEFILVGDESAVQAELAKHGTVPTNIRIVHAPEVIDMGDAPAVALRAKRNSSVTVSVQLVAEGKAEAVFSAGNTGAAVAAATVLLKPLGNIKRSGIAVSFPTHYGTTTLIDVGANIHCQPIHLFQYALMATVFSEQMFGIKDPRVGLLNIGSEDKKGNELVRETRRLLEEHPRINFIGNIEGYDIHRGVCDVAVCEGFVGNVVLKLAEGIATSLLAEVEQAFKKVFGDDKRYAEALSEVKRRNDATEYGGAPLLGVDGIVIIGHGSSVARSIYNALRVARGFGGKNVNRQIAEVI